MLLECKSEEEIEDDDTEDDSGCNLSCFCVVDCDGSSRVGGMSHMYTFFKQLKRHVGCGANYHEAITKVGKTHG